MRKTNVVGFNLVIQNTNYNKYIYNSYFNFKPLVLKCSAEK